MEWFDGYERDGEPAGVLELPESMTLPGMALDLHVGVGEGDRTVAFWMLDDDTFVVEVEPGLA
jgi:hypothetical protein